MNFDWLFPKSVEEDRSMMGYMKKALNSSEVKLFVIIQAITEKWSDRAKDDKEAGTAYSARWYAQQCEKEIHEVFEMLKDAREESGSE